MTRSLLSFVGGEFQIDGRIPEKDLTGEKFEKFEVLRQATINESKGEKELHWLCQCDCGKIFVRDSRNIKKNHGCGCIRLTHGFTVKSNPLFPIFMIWKSMIHRCMNPRSEDWKNYGERGIGISDNWLNSFEKFVEDMGPRPSSDHSINRIDNDGDYCKENCVWSTATDQARNRREPSKKD